jgi:hypothetical protein
MPPSPGGQERPAHCQLSSCGSAALGVATSARESWSKHGHWSVPRRNASPTRRCGHADVCANKTGGLSRTRTSRPLSPVRSWGSSLGAQTKERKRWRRTQPTEGADGSVVALPAGRSILRPSALPWSRRCGTSTPATTGCSCPALTAPRPERWSRVRSIGYSTLGRHDALSQDCPQQLSPGVSRSASESNPRRRLRSWVDRVAGMTVNLEDAQAVLTHEVVARRRQIKPRADRDSPQWTR